MEEYFSFERVQKNFPKIWECFPTTLKIVAVAMLIGIIIGLVVAFVRIHKVPVLSQLAYVYVSFIRGTPLIIQLFIAYYGIPMLFQNAFGININRLDAIYFVFAAYGISEGAYLSELFRGGLVAIPAGQSEAAYSVGLTKLQTFRRVIFPQAIRIILPGFGVELIALFQGTSMAASVGVLDVMGRAGLVGAATYHYTESYFCAAVIFIVLSIVLEIAFKLLSKKLKYAR